MKEIVVIPNESVAEIRLGMTREQVEAIVAKLCAENGGADRIPDSEFNQTRMPYVTYRLGRTGIYYYITYLDNKVAEITVNRGIEGQAIATLYGVDLFFEKAQDVIAKLRSYGPCVCDCADPLLAYTYDFPTLGIGLWREMVYHPKLLLTQEYQEMSPENVEYQKRFEYFGRCSLGTPAYWEALEGICQDTWYPVER